MSAPGIDDELPLAAGRLLQPLGDWGRDHIGDDN